MQSSERLEILNDAGQFVQAGFQGLMETRKVSTTFGVSSTVNR
jgi:hypothetical protein